MTFTVKMIDHVVLYVSDMERSVHFYEAVLGCKVVRHNTKLNLMHLSAGSSMIDLLPAPDPESTGQNVDHVALQIEPFDADALMTHLRNHGLDPTAPRDRFGAGGTGPSLTFRDPDGNTIELKGPASAP
ncbi:VOC family protein [Pseudohalocynthiibacter sp. F2068]|uniref:VOC family protein n=1 Tax=Pseudohalocynthiibacter sp. F2068 TaxID=2926418 RepID=UPI001FF4E6F6|nr:VOC family protein [Pseudohalocynthiibacter sp. F2068]MCK0100682.1 VOC family protein [Pseudohalocynthiibacter sp. F2068]